MIFNQQATAYEGEIPMDPERGAPEVDDDDPNIDDIRFIRDAANKEDPYLYSLRGSAYTSILFAHSLQTYAYSLTQGRMVDLRDEDDNRSSVVFNIILPTIEAQIGMLLAKQPDRVVEATTRDDRDIEAAHYASDILKWAGEYHDINSVYESAANWLTKTGNAFVFTGWDPTGGRFFQTENGEMVFEGDPMMRVDSMFAWTFHPQAKTVEESPYAHHTQMVHRSWLEEHYPEVVEEMEGRDGSIAVEGGMLFESALLNLSPSHGGLYFASNNSGGNYPKGEGFYEIQTLYVRSSPKHPRGRMIMALAVNGEPFKILTKPGTENPYIDWMTGRHTLPVVHIKNLPVPGRLLGESSIIHLMPMQRSINKHRGQIHDNASYNANPRLYVYEDGVSPDSITDDPGAYIPVPPGSSPPGYIQAPELPSYLMNAENAALQFAEIMSRPFGPLRTAQESVTSGVQQMIVQEQQDQLIAPMVRRWEMGWDRMWKLYLNNWRTFAKLPRKVQVAGEDGAWREAYFSGDIARANIVVSIREGSAMPVSRTAVFAEWVELIKSGAAPIQLDPLLAKAFWKDMGKPELARTYRDQTVHIDKARRNIQRIRSGEVRIAEPQDDPQAHLVIYRNWMAGPEFEMEAQRDQGFAQRMVMLVQSMEMLAGQIAMAQMQVSQMMAGGDPGGENAGNPGADRVQKANAKQPGEAGGDGGAPRRTQGFAGQNLQQGGGGNEFTT